MFDRLFRWRCCLLSCFVPAALALAPALAAADQSAAPPGQESAAYTSWSDQAATRLRQKLDDTTIGADVSLVVHLTVLHDGTVAGVLFTGTTDKRAVAAAQRMVRRTGQLPPLPTSVPRDFVTLTLPIHFR